LKVFITGASSGIGEALAVYYAGQGATLGLAARRGDFLDGLNQRLGGGHACYALDVCDAPALHMAAVDFVDRFGAPDIVIANAGVSAGTLTEFEEDLGAFRRVMDTNVFGMAATFAPFIPAMRAASGVSGKFGRLVGIASVAGIRGLPGAEAYSASKAAAIAYLESLRLEMRPYGIKVVTIAPGYIETPMTAVNPYKMPFLLPAAKAAEQFARAVERGVSYTVIPWQMGLVAKLLRVLPNWLYDRLFTRAPRKPRGLLK
jgi:NAD(P)-dependent dehydrogenase (short-subunit alcohol dehydrogenase family)